MTGSVVKFRTPRGLVLAMLFATITCAEPVAPSTLAYDEGGEVALPTPRDSAGAVRSSALSVSIGTSSIAVGDTTRAQLLARDNWGRWLLRRGTPVAWTSTNPDVAGVDARTGLITGAAPGNAQIVGSVSGYSARADVVVSTPPAAPVQSIVVVLEAQNVTVGATTRASAYLSDAAGNPLTGRRITWTSADPAVASVDSTGRVTGVKEGWSAIIATSEGVSGQNVLQVMRPPVVPVATVTVTLNASTLTPGSNTGATATARDANGNLITGRSVSWTSSDPAVATVDSAGRVTAVAAGTADVVARIDDVTGSARVTVAAPPPVPVATVVVVLERQELTVGATMKASAFVRDSAGNTLTGRKVAWSAADPTVATVDSAGTVTGVKPGWTAIVATSEGISGQNVLQVLPPAVVPVTTVTVTLNASTLTPGSNTGATAAAFDANGNLISGRPVSWSSSNPAVVTVDSATGRVTAVSQGTADVVARIDNVTGSARVTVAPPPPVPVATVVVVLEGENLAVGATMKASAILRDAAGSTLTGRKVTWRAADPAVATVDSTGSVKGVMEGWTAIIATSEGVSGQNVLQIVPSAPAPPTPVSRIQVALGASSLVVGATTTASATLYDSAGHTLTGRSVQWTSSNTTVASVNSNGVVTARLPGSAQIRATSEGITGSASLTVTAPAVATVTVSLGTSSLMVGATTQATAVARDALGAILTGRSVSWTSSNTSVASVSSSGLVTARAAGSATIRATIEGITGQASLSVTATVPPPGSVTTFFNSSEPGCDGSDSSVLWCDDFERGYWFVTTADKSNPLNAGWNGTPYGSSDPQGRNFGRCSGAGVAGTSCTATNGGHTGIGQARAMGDHDLRSSTNEIYFRYYVKPLPGYLFGQEKALTFNKDAAGVGGIYFGTMFFGLGSGQSSAQPSFLEINADRNRFQNMGNNISLTGGNWYFIELHLKLNGNGSDVLEMWIDNCGPTGTGCTGTPTLRMRHTDMKLRPTGDNSSLFRSIWLENWANPAAVGEMYYDQIKVSRTGPIGFAR